jgi:hypothetical protein
VTPINSSLLTTRLYSSVITTPVYNEIEHSVPCMTLKPRSTPHICKWRRSDEMSCYQLASATNCFLLPSCTAGSQVPTHPRLCYHIPPTRSTRRPVQAYGAQEIVKFLPFRTRWTLGSRDALRKESGSSLNHYGNQGVNQSESLRH